jgi:hypothetical protein
MGMRSTARRELIKLLRDINFGRIEDLIVRQGQPVLSPPPRIVLTLRFGSDKGADGLPTLEELAVRPAVQELLLLLSRMGDGRLHRVEVRAGSPCYAEAETISALSGGVCGRP